jgi:kinesin family protein C1
VTEQSSSGLTQEATTRALRTKLENLETITYNRDARIKDLEEALSDALSTKDEMQDKLRLEETIRRKLHNQIQELKGNIRVFCRVRPALEQEKVEGGRNVAEIKFPDIKGEGREIECIEDKGESSMGKELIKNYPFQFDKVFLSIDNTDYRCLLLKQRIHLSLRRFHNWYSRHWMDTMYVFLHMVKLDPVKHIACPLRKMA